MKNIIISAAVLLVAIYYIITEVIWQLRNRLFRRRIIIGVLVAALLVSQLDIMNLFMKTDAGTSYAAEAESLEIITVSAFAGLPDDIRVQSVPIGTALDELKLPNMLEAVCVVTDDDVNADVDEDEGTDTDTDVDVDADTDKDTDIGDSVDVKTDEDTDIGDSADVKTDEDTDIGEDTDVNSDTDIDVDLDVDIDTDTDIDADNDADTNADTYTDTDVISGNNSLGNITDTEGNTVVAETFSVTMPEYRTENILEVKTLKADTLSGASEEAERSRISEPSQKTITIENVTWQSEPEYDGDVEGEYIFTAILPEGYALTDMVNNPEITVMVGNNDDKEQTEKLLMTGWHFGEEDVYPQGNLFYDEERYSFVLAGGRSETQIPFEEIVDFLPTVVMAEFSQEEVLEEVLPITGWICPEYVQDEEGYLPYRGEFFFTALLSEDNTYKMSENTTQPGVWVIFDEPMPLAADEPVIIDSDVTWGTKTLAEGTYTINPGVTVTLTGEVTISGKVTINGNGGGKIVRGSSGGLFYVVSSGNLTLADVEVDGNKVSSSRPMISVPSGSITLDDGCWIHDCTKNTLKGGAININGGTGVFNDILIENCSATSYGGAVYVYQGQLTINGGIYRNNSTSDSSTVWGGGFAFNNQGRLYIYGGSFINNTSASRAGGIYTSSNANTETYLYGGYFSGNKSSYPGYEGSGALNYSAVEDNDTILQLSGSVQLVGDGEYGTDGLFLDISSNSSTFRKARISSQLQYPLPIYLKASEGYVIAEGVEGYKLQERDMKKIFFYDVNNSGEKWYAVLDKDKNQIYLSTTDPDYDLYVTYNGNGASGAVIDGAEYTNGDTVTLKSGDGFSYEGHTFIGWNTKADGTGISYQPGDEVVITEDLYLYAQWWQEAQEKFRVTYNYTANGGSTSTAVNADVATGTAIDLTPEATKNGWEFVGWNTDQNEKTGLTFLKMGNSPVTLYAIFKKTLTAGFYSGSNNSEQAKSVTIYNNEKSGTVTAPALTAWSGWTVSGWSTNASTYNSSVAANATITLTEDTDYYGIYSKTVTLSYNANGGSGAPSSQSGTRYANVHGAITYQDPSFTLAAAISRTGYTFNGWHKGSASGIASNAGTSITLSDDTTFYAGWTADTYTVKYEKNGGTIADENKYISYTYGLGLTLPKPTRTGYTFGGWFTDSDFSGAEVKSISATDTGAKTYYAKWVNDIAPEITLSYSYEPTVFMDWLIGNKSLVITVHVTEAESGVDEIKYTVTESGKGQGEEKIASLVNGEAKITVNKDFKGSIKVTCTDTAGKSSGEVTVGTDIVGKDNVNGIIIEDHAPQISFVNGNEAISSSEYFEPSELNFAVSITDEVNGSDSAVISGGIASVTYQIGSKAEKSIDNNFKTAMVTVCNFIIPTSELSTGENKITVTVKDNAGNTAKSELTVGLKGQENKPNASVDCENGILTGFVPGAEYDIAYTDVSGTLHTDTVTADENGNLEIEDNWTGGSIDIVKKGNGTNTTDSDKQTVHIPVKEKKPYPKTEDVSSQGQSDGKITDLEPNETYEISKDGGKTWETKTADSKGEISGLPAGDYKIRTKAKDNSDGGTLCSDVADCKIGTKSPSESNKGSSGPEVQNGTSGGQTSDDRDSGQVGNTSTDTVTPLTETPETETPKKETSKTEEATQDTDAKTEESEESEQSTNPDTKPSAENADQTSPAETENDEVNITGDSIATGTITGAQNTTTTLTVGKGSVSVTVVSDEYQYAAGVADTVAVANAVLTQEQIQLVNNGEKIEIRVDVKDISEQVSKEDKDIIENRLTAEDREEELALGAYIDISMFIKIGDGDWNAITQSGEEIDVVIEIPNELQAGGRTFYIARCHEGQYALLEDLDTDAETITIRTALFSTYAIVYRQADTAGSKCGLCHICPTFLGICCFIWLAIIMAAVIVVILIVSKRQREGKLSFK